jgi:hypothetical protein
MLPELCEFTIYGGDIDLFGRIEQYGLLLVCHRIVSFRRRETTCVEIYSTDVKIP